MVLAFGPDGYPDRYLDQDVNPQIVSRILGVLSAAPTGGNSCDVKYTVTDDKERIREIWRLACSKMGSDAKQHIHPHCFSDFHDGKMKQAERTVRKNDFVPNTKPGCQKLPEGTCF